MIDARAVGLVAHAHLTVWRADLRQTLGGSSRTTAAGAVALLVVAATAVLSWTIAPEFADVATRERAARAVLVVVAVVGAMVWTALSLAVPDASAVDTVLTAVPASSRERRTGLALVSVAPALTLTLVVALAVSGGLVRDARGPLDAVNAAAIVLATAVLGLGAGALAGGAVAWLLQKAGLLSGPTCRGIAATVVVGVFGAGLTQVMRDVDAGASAYNPLPALGQAAAAGLERPVVALPVSLLAVVVGTLAVVAGASLGRTVVTPTSLSSRLARVLPSRDDVHHLPSWIALQGRQLVRFQSNVGLLVLVGLGAVGCLSVAGSHSAVFAHSTFFAISSLLTTSAVTVAGVEGRADWLYRSLGRWPGHVLTRLSAYLIGWVGFIATFGALMAWRATDFAISDVVGVAPLLTLELGIVLVIGALVPVTDEHGLSAMTGEFAAIVAVILVALGLPRVPGLEDLAWGMTVVGLGGGAVGVLAYLLVMLDRVPRARLLDLAPEGPRALAQ